MTLLNDKRFIHFSPSHMNSRAIASTSSSVHTELHVRASKYCTVVPRSPFPTLQDIRSYCRSPSLLNFKHLFVLSPLHTPLNKLTMFLTKANRPLEAPSSPQGPGCAVHHHLDCILTCHYAFFMTLMILTYPHGVSTPTQFNIYFLHTRTHTSLISEVQRRAKLGNTSFFSLQGSTLSTTLLTHYLTDRCACAFSPY